MEVSVILPVYNEVENLEPLLAELEETLAPWQGKFEVIAVDDGSTDGSTQRLERLSFEKSYLKVISFRRNSGQSAAFDAGFRHASGRIVVTMDADRQNDPKDIPKMIEMLSQGYDFISGWRRKRHDGWFLRTLPSRVANAIIRKATGTRVHDMGCSLKIYRKEITDELRLYGEMHRFLAVLVEGVGARVGEFEVNHRPRVAGKSKYGLNRTLKVLLDLLTVWFMKGYRTKPIYLFGGVGVALFSSGLLASTVVLYEKFFQGTWVHRNPLFMLALMLAVIGVQFLGMGLIAEIIIRIYFEAQDKAAYTISRMFGFEEENVEKLPQRRGARP